ncbi:DEAD/DEAH box helicase family protein [Bifidobacterium amazonense]|uniref:DEAD/DEAH box helicase family protein n=1 Tax=Bifidobacterium amazonense TaxID=2809027 RepID=A0ABS9VYI2_9BIFI|nr:DEAD/DEAH box helicase family protein [Bifidobacterium amazonense]MCH9277172.1 DEAD/DEAH box helicase family protein [Bifidobacterium amazonense]
MRQPVYDKPRIIYRGEETEDEILLPRGCKEPLNTLLSSADSAASYVDERNPGTRIQTAFTGTLRDRQRDAANALLAHDNGILVAPTGFGKTVIAAEIIAQRNINTLIVVRSSALLGQWKERLGQFLDITTTPPTRLTKTGRVSRRQPDAIGQIGAGRHEANGIIDIALAQSLFDKGDVPGTKHVKEVVTNYGMVIFDECHHVASVDTETIARTVNAKYVYGLTGTLKRDDGLQPIVTMQCGPVRYTVDVKDQMATQRFTRRFVPRFVSADLGLVEPFTYHDYLQTACDSEERNAMILDDAMNVIKEGRTPLLLTKRTEHARTLADELERRGCRHVILLYGADPKKTQIDNIERLAHIPDKEQLAVVATGSYIGEGFDQKRFDTLMLAAPVSVETAVTQYVGRLHRDNDGKHEVRVYDYIDVSVSMALSMYRKRLKTYASQGYEPLLPDGGDVTDEIRQAKATALLSRKAALAGGGAGVSPAVQTGGEETLVGMDAFFEKFLDDIARCGRSIVIHAGYVSHRGIDTVGDALVQATGRGVAVDIVVRVPDTATVASRARTERNAAKLRAMGCAVRTAASCNEFVVIDDELVWFGTIEPLGNPKDDDCSLRLRDRPIAQSLIARG